MKEYDGKNNGMQVVKVHADYISKRKEENEDAEPRLKNKKKTSNYRASSETRRTWLIF